MRVKRYVVDSMPDALQQIRTDLGGDAVILNTKEIRSGGFLGLFSKKKIEVIAATDAAPGVGKAGRPNLPPEPLPAKHRQAEPHSKASAVAVMDHPVASFDEKAADLLESLGALRKQEENSLSKEKEPPPLPKPVIPAAHGAALYGGTGGGGVEALPRPTASSPVKQETSPPQTALVQASPVHADGAVLDELRAVKQLVQKLSAGVVLPDEPNPEIVRLEQRLLEQEVRPEIVANLLNDLEQQAQESGVEITREYAEQHMKDQLLLSLGANARKPLQPDTKIAHFVGPTGVGKTTTIAKLAAEQVLKHRKRVGFITSDTYRIAAVDQLKTYATILGIPLEVVFSPLDLKKAYEKLEDCDIIFMDTAGRNFRNEMYVSELNALLQTGGKSETYLVLSLTMKYKDMKAVADNFSKFKLDKVLFTKCDETKTYGSIINLIHDFPLQLSYITNGQNVPDDFSVFNENEIIELIMEEELDE